MVHFQWANGLHAVLGDVQSGSSTVVIAANPEDGQSGQHTDAGQSETVFESVRFTDVCYDRGCHQSTDVDADVKDRKA